MTSLPIILAQDAAGTGAAGLFGSPIVFPILMLVMFYFILIRPQKQRQKDQESMQSAVKVDDQVITVGGAHGVITSVKEKTVMVRLGEHKVEFDKSAIATVKKTKDKE